jgi:hypothetical protein
MLSSHWVTSSRPDNAIIPAEGNRAIAQQTLPRTVIHFITATVLTRDMEWVTERAQDPVCQSGLVLKPSSVLAFFET